MTTSFIQSTLDDDEVILYEARLSLWAQTPWIIFGIAWILMGMFLFTVMGTILGFIPLAVAAGRYWTTEVGFTNFRIVARWGLISPSILELNARKIDAVRVHQTIPGKILGFGDILISGLGSNQSPIPFISNPDLFKRQFDETFGRF